MNDVVADGRGSLLHRVMRTPVRRLLRGKIGPGLTVDDVVSDLPGAAAAVVRDVVGRSRLWRAEKLSVSEELAAHFHDGLDAGASVEDLVRDFGDPRTAAKLIRRAKLRNRPMVWHIARWTGRAIAALVLIYITMGLYYLTGEPKLTVDYVAQLQAEIKAVPEEERAWPLYREALLSMGELPELPDSARRDDEALAKLYPGHERWAPIAEYLHEHQQAIALVRQGAAKPALGFVVGEWDPTDEPLWPDQQPARDSWPGDIWDGAMFTVLLPHLSKMREMSIVLRLDLHRAAAAGDADTVVDDMRALLGIAQHAADTPILINQLVGLAILRGTFSEIQQVLARHPGLLRDQQMIELAHALVTTQQVMRIDMSGERQMFHDVIQRTFTQGADGHLTFEGLDAMRQLRVNAAPVEFEEFVATTAGYPVFAMTVGSRQEILDEYERLLSAEYERRLDQPMWEWVTRDAVDELDNMSLTERMRYLPISVLQPALKHVGETVQWVRAERDATQVALALELYRRRQGEFPGALEQMAPGLLPEVPPDRFTGKAMKYRVVDGAPLVYSVGVDRDDDGGRAIEHSPSQPDPAKQWMAVEELPKEPERAAKMDGDWILYDPAGVTVPRNK